MFRWRAFLVLLLPLAACANTPDYPMDRPGTWSPPAVGSNDKNLRTMIADPQDLVAGKGEANSRGTAAAAPVERLNTGKRLPLPTSESSKVYGGTGAQSTGGGAGVGTSSP